MVAYWSTSLQRSRTGLILIGQSTGSNDRRRLSTLGDRFDQANDGFVWLASLQTRKFGIEFNQSLDGVGRPVLPKQLAFGGYFTQAIDGVHSRCRSNSSRLCGVSIMQLMRLCYWRRSSS